MATNNEFKSHIEVSKSYDEFVYKMTEILNLIDQTSANINYTFGYIYKHLDMIIKYINSVSTKAGDIMTEHIYFNSDMMTDKEVKVNRMFEFVIHCLSKNQLRKNIDKLIIVYEFLNSPAFTIHPYKIMDEDVSRLFGLKAIVPNVFARMSSPKQFIKSLKQNCLPEPKTKNNKKFKNKKFLSVVQNIMAE